MRNSYQSGFEGGQVFNPNLKYQSPSRGRGSNLKSGMFGGSIGASGGSNGQYVSMFDNITGTGGVIK